MQITQAIQIGHLHPLFVHLPIGVLVFAFVLEIYQRSRKAPLERNITQLALAFAAITALLSLGTGWLLGDDGGYDETALFRHRWMAVALTACSIILYFFKKTNVSWGQKLYMPLFIVTMVLLGITGHLGGNMTHGEDYLFQEKKSNEIAITDVNKAKVYADIIQPIFDNKCVSCHNPKKAKGELLLTDKLTLLKGGENGSILDSLEGNAASLLHRIHLPLTEEEHMPPKGKVQLTEEEIILIGWWMENENCFDCTAGYLDKNQQIATILKSLETDTSPRGLIARSVEPIPQDWLNELVQNGISAQRIAENSELVMVNLSNKVDLKKDTFDELNDYAENIVEINLGYSNFDDSMAKVLSKYKNLTKLQLQQTKITDKSISQFKKMQFLESLNLYGTKTTSVSLDHLKELKNLNRLYIYETEMAKADLEKFKNEAPNVVFQHLSDTIFTEALLNKPYIVEGTDFFHDTQKIKLEHVFKEADVLYTLDGSEPTANSTKYTDPIAIDKSTTLKVFAQKKDWKSSDVLTVKFKKSGVAYDSVWLNKPPHKNYKGKGGKTLVDLSRGSVNFQDGKWLGFQATHFTTTMRLKEPTEISTVSVGALMSPSSWVFYPVGFNIWASDDNKKYKLIGELKLPKQEKSAEVATTFFDVNFPKTNAHYVKIEVKSILKNPSWHPNPGGKSWVFVDEIIIN